MTVPTIVRGIYYSLQLFSDYHPVTGFVTGCLCVKYVAFLEINVSKNDVSVKEWCILCKSMPLFDVFDTPNWSLVVTNGTKIVMEM